jgi:SAM-dependent methyltransferase
VRAALDARYETHPRIAVIPADRTDALPVASFDLIVMHSVAQYLSNAELTRLLVLFRTLIKPDGLVVIGDIVPPALAAPAAALALLRFAAANGFFWAAVGGLIRIFVSDYLRLKKTVGLSHYTEAAMLTKLKDASLVGRRAPHNIGHNQWRMTFVGRTS